MFSIVMPVWNKRPWLAATLAGVLAQSRRDFELIAVDDGSTDGSLELLRACEDPRLVLIALDHGGSGQARNTGLAAARGDWIALLDADDLWLPDHLAELDRIRAAFPEAGLIGTGFVECGPRGAPRPPAASPDRIERIDFFAEPRPFFTSSSAIAASAVRALGGFCGRVPGEDAELFARIALARPVAVSRRVTAFYRRHTGGISDAAASPWQGKAIAGIGDIEPSLDLLARHLPTLDCPARRRAMLDYVDRKLRWCLRRAARTGDVGTLRALPPLFSRPPPRDDRLILRLARLPRPLAGAALALGAALGRLRRRLSQDIS